MTGRLFAIVGPSGVGKDSLIAAVSKSRPELRVVRRVITRPESAGGEPFEGVSPAEFLARQKAGEFALFWKAHGLNYGIPTAINDDLAAGYDVIFNCSRSLISKAKADFAGLVVVLVTASAEVLAQRLAGRGRESQGEIAARLERAETGATADFAPDVIIENETTLDAARDALLREMARYGIEEKVENV